MPERLRLLKGDEVLVSDLRQARRVRERIRGLIGDDGLAPGSGLLLEPARQVHTFGMSYPIDVLFCDASWRVVHIARSLRPNRVTRVVFRARRAVELPAGAAAGVRAGDGLILDQSEDRER